MANQNNQQIQPPMAQIDAQTFAAKYSGKKEVSMIWLFYAIYLYLYFLLNYIIL